MSVPEDKGQRLYILFFMHGLGMLMPWYTMIKSLEYYEFHGYRQEFDEKSLYLGIASRVPYVLFQIIIIFVPKRCGNLSTIMVYSIVIQALAMVFTEMLVFFGPTQTKEAPKGPIFWMTVVFNFVMGVGGGIYQSCSFGAAANMPMKYTNALCVGINLGSVILSISDIIEVAMGEHNKHMVALIFFSATIFMHIVCIILENNSESNELRVYYHNRTESDSKSDESIRIEDRDIKGNRYKYVLSQIYVQLLDIFLIFLVTYSIYPWVMVAIESTHKGIPDQYFDSVMNTVFHSLKLFGTITAMYVHYPTPESMIGFTSIRLLLVPIYLFLDYKPRGIDRKLPVLIDSASLCWSLNVILSITNGHLTVLTLMYTPEQVRPQFASIAGMMSSLMLTIASIFGYTFTLLLKNII